MGSNRFGKLFTFTTWGESHGPAVGVVIDGCPAGIKISKSKLISALKKRRPGQKFTSPRKESDFPIILSGVFKGITLGSPISVLVYNEDVKSGSYHSHKHLFRPGHADYTYFKKYGVYDHRGGGRASARETVGRVIAGEIAKAFLTHHNIKIKSRINSIGGNTDPKQWNALLEKAILEKDSLGGVIEVKVENVPVGLGQPIYYKMESMLANAMLSLPASKGFEIGKGFESTTMKGSEHNDPFIVEKDQVVTATNHCGGTLGGITTGMPLEFKVAFKPISTIKKIQQTVDRENKPQSFKGQSKGRHDPCPILRAVPIVEAMTATVLTDSLLMHRLTRKECCFKE